MIRAVIFSLCMAFLLFANSSTRVEAFTITTLSSRSRCGLTSRITSHPRHFSKGGNDAVRDVVYSSNSCLSMGRRWNFNEGRGPWGIKRNAEVWNGRVAQMAFTVVLLQELITGKGVIAGLQDGDFLSQALLGVTVVATLALTAFLAIQGKEDDISFDRSELDP